MGGINPASWFRFFTNAMASTDGVDKLRQAGFFFVDAENSWASNSAVMDESGQNSQVISSTAVAELIHPDDVGGYKRLWDRVVQGWEDTFLAEYRMRTPEGTYRWIRTEILILRRLANGGLGQYFGRDRDIQPRKESEQLLMQRLADAENRLLQIETLRVAGLVLSTPKDLDSTVDLVLEQASSLAEFSKAALYSFQDNHLTLLKGLDETPQDETPVAMEPCDDAPSLICRVLESQVPHIADDLSMFEPPYPGDPGERYRSWLGIPLVYQRKVIGLLSFWHRSPGVYRSEQIWPLMGFGESVALAMVNARTYQSLKDDAQTDALTNLGTRRVLELSGPLLVEEVVRQHHPLALILLDLDHFKKVNDRYGHLTGDEVLKSVGHAIRSNLRSSDLAIRFGGEEFVAMLPETTSAEARAVADRLKRTLEQTTIPGMDAPVTGSFGLVFLPANVPTTLDRLLEKADQAMYHAKTRGRNQIVEIHVGP